MKVTEEMLDIIRFIKITAIEKFFYNKVNSKREKEIDLTVKKGLNGVLIICLYWLASPLFVSTAFLAYVYLDYALSAEVIFTTMTIVSIFEYPMYSIPTAISEAIQVVSSL
jgi:hypothetical protein